jgi:hypothetical protein
MIQTIARGVTGTIETAFLGVRPASALIDIKYTNDSGDLTTLVSAGAATVDPMNWTLGGAAAAKDRTLTLASKTITAATNATPIAITAAAHGFLTGDSVRVTGVLGNTAANGLWTVTKVDANTFTLTGSVGNGAWTSGGACWPSAVAGRRYKIGVAGGIEPDENVTVKSASDTVPQVTLWAPLMFAHANGAAFTGLRASYSVAGSLTTNTAEDLGFWTDGYATWTPATGDPVIEIVHCVKFKIPDICCDLSDLLQVMPKIRALMDPEFDWLSGYRTARDNMLMDFGGRRLLFAAGSSGFRELCAMRFILDRRSAFGKDWFADMEDLRARYEAKIELTRINTPADINKDGKLNDPANDLTFRMAAV